MSPPVALQCSRPDNKIIGRETGGGKFQISLARDQISNAVSAEVVLERTEAGALYLLNSGACDACILHLSANGRSIAHRTASVKRMIEAGIAVFILADRGLEWSAVEMVHLGAKGYSPNDGEFRLLKNQIRDDNQEPSRTSADAGMPDDLSAPVKCMGLIGTSPQIQDVSNMIQLVAPLDVPVFIHGETGTGKEVIARAIHNCGNRVGRPFVALSCGAIPETLLEAELFGHEKGAFTGTVGTRQGNLEEAADGTLLFDEIGELSLPAQVKLLRVLQESEFRRLGSNRLIPLRARLIFATHQDLDVNVGRGTFRQDLYYRLDVVRINVPPLRNRLEDIPLLVAHFIQLHARRCGLPASEIDSETLTRLQEHAWPGNVRELEHVIQSALIVSRGETLRPHHLPERFFRAKGDVIAIDGHNSDEPFEQQLATFKLKVAQAAVRKCYGNKTLAARSLSISRPYLHRLLRIGDEEALFDDQDDSPVVSM